MPELPESEARRTERFFNMNLPRIHLRLQDARTATGAERALLWIDAFEVWNYTHKEILGYVEALGQIFRNAGRLSDLDVLSMPLPNDHFYADGQEMLEAIQRECLLRNLETAAVTRLMRLYQMVNDGLTLTKEQNDGTTAERKQHVLKILHPFFTNGLDPGSALTDLLAKLRHQAAEEKKTSSRNVLFAGELSEFIRDSAYMRWAKQQRTEALSRQRQSEAAGSLIVPVTPEQLENDDVLRWDKVIQSSWRDMQTKRKAVKQLAFTPELPINGVEPCDWRTRVLCEVDKMAEALAGQHEEVAALDPPNYDESKILELLQELKLREDQARNAKCGGTMAAIDNLRDAPVEAQTSTQPRKPIGRGMTWQEAMKVAEDHCARNTFPGVNALAKIVRQTTGRTCSKPTILKAIDRSAKLRAKKADHEAQHKSVSARTMTEGTTASARQTRERDPGEAASTDEIFRALVEQSEDTDRAKLNAMSDAQRRELVEAMDEDSVSELFKPRSR